MNAKLPNPMRRLWLSALLLAFCSDFASQSAAQQPPAGGTKPAADSVLGAAAAQRLIHSSRQAVRQLASVQAKTRQRVRMFGHTLAGAGVYLQTGPPDRPEWISETKMQAGGDTLVRQEVCDGDVLWRRSSDSEGGVVHRVDLESIRRQLAVGGRRARDLDFAALGGVPKILDTLAREYQFKQARASQLSGEPVWVLEGVRESESAALRHAPDYVQVILSRAASLPLFPYRIEYFRLAREDDDSEAAKTPLLVCEWYAIRVDQKIDPRRFRFTPGDIEVRDGTEDALESIKTPPGRRGSR